MSSGGFTLVTMDDKFCFQDVWLWNVFSALCIVTFCQSFSWGNWSSGQPNLFIFALQPLVKAHIFILLPYNGLLPPWFDLDQKHQETHWPTRRTMLNSLVQNSKRETNLGSGLGPSALYSPFSYPGYWAPTPNIALSAQKSAKSTPTPRTWVLLEKLNE